MKNRNGGIFPTKILVIEDNPGDQVLIRRALEECDRPIELVMVASAEEGLVAVSNPASIPDLILVDLNLPQMHGLDFLTELKSTWFSRRIPAFVLTSSAADDEIALSYDAHANAYLTKPLHLSGYTGILKLIESWIDVVHLPQVMGPLIRPRDGG